MRMNKISERRKLLTVDNVSYLLVLLDTPKSLACYLLFKNKEYAQLANMGCDPLHYNDASSFFKDNQAVCLLKKFPFKGLSPTAAAMRTFIKGEEQCFDTNERIREGRINDPNTSMVLFHARALCSNILRDVPEIKDLKLSFGPGASLNTRKDTSFVKKLGNTVQSTIKVLSIYNSVRETLPVWLGPVSKRSEVVMGAELAFVPKNAKTDRPICIEPILNGLFQKGIGSYMKTQLLRVGVDLSDQTRNQRLAKRALRDGLATVDFSNASDTISIGIVCELLPEPWVDFLSLFRSPYYLVNPDLGLANKSTERKPYRAYPFEKFSSMGNGYTFELESLIFYSIAVGCCKVKGLSTEDVSVYGDDVIIPASVYSLFTEVCSQVGLTVNTDKSFSDGCFFESCGADYFNGIDVRPMYFKREISRVKDMFSYINLTMEKLVRFVPKARYDSYRAFLLAKLPPKFRLVVPYCSSSDIGVWAPWDVVKPSLSFDKKRQWDGYWVKGVTERGKNVEYAHTVVNTLYAASMSGDDATFSKGYSMVGDRGQDVIRKIFIPRSALVNEFPVAWDLTSLTTLHKLEGGLISPLQTVWVSIPF